MVADSVQTEDIKLIKWRKEVLLWIIHTAICLSADAAVFDGLFYNLGSRKYKTHGGIFGSLDESSHERIRKLFS